MTMVNDQNNTFKLYNYSLGNDDDAKFTVGLLMDNLALKDELVLDMTSVATLTQVYAQNVVVRLAQENPSKIEGKHVIVAASKHVIATFIHAFKSVSEKPEQNAENIMAARRIFDSLQFTQSS